jgi:hypothetical protein
MLSVTVAISLNQICKQHHCCRRVNCNSYDVQHPIAIDDAAWQITDVNTIEKLERLVKKCLTITQSMYAIDDAICGHQKG